MSDIQITTITFRNAISRSMLSLFRGAVISSLSRDNILFHNHRGDGFRYSYPLIQYKTLGGKASIVCIGEGCSAIRDYFSGFSSTIALGDTETELFMESVREKSVSVSTGEEMNGHRLVRWLPLNKENYEEYVRTESVTAKCAMLEKILVGNILSFGKGVGIVFEDEVKCLITDIRRQYPASYKGVRLMAFDISFKTNVSLPYGIGLGKGVSIGNGTVLPDRQERVDADTVSGRQHLR